MEQEWAINITTLVKRKDNVKGKKVFEGSEKTHMTNVKKIKQLNNWDVEK